MPRKSERAYKCEDFLAAIEEQEITIADAFQRGTEQLGVWSLAFKRAFIDSFIKDFPFGLIILVKKAGNPLSPWSILDGANKSRCLRDFRNNLFKDNNGKHFDDWEMRLQEAFKAKTFTVQEVKVTRDDPRGVIAEMFERLNTRVVPLSAGELTNALGWQKDIWPIELARTMIHWDATSWEDEMVAGALDWGNLQDRWEAVFGTLISHKRLNNLSFWTGIIISSMESNIRYFKKNYNLQKDLLLNEKETTDEVRLQKQTKVFNDITILLDFIVEIDDPTLWGVRQGIPSITKVAVIWHIILAGESEGMFEIVTQFYKAIFDNTELRDTFKEKMTAGGDNHVNGTKIGRALEFINEWGVNLADDEE
jgi:hypothetical protein